MVLGTSTALDKFKRQGHSKVMIGTDFKVLLALALALPHPARGQRGELQQPATQVVAITDLGLGAAEDAGAMAASGDAVSITLADGLIVDWSVVGEHARALLVHRRSTRQHLASACCMPSC